MTITEPSATERARLEATRGLVKLSRSYAIEGAELRAVTDSGVGEFYGHASVTGKPYEMYGGPTGGGWNETVDKGAFKRSLGRKPEVPLLLNHEGPPMASTWNNTLQLAEDDTGLEVRAQLDTTITDIAATARRLETGLLREMSFAFRVKKQEWLNAEGEEVPWWDLSGIERHLVELDLNKGDVSIVNFGANPNTDATLRSLDALRINPPDDLDEIRATIDYLESLLPTPELHPDLAAAYWQSYKRTWSVGNGTP